MIVSRTDEGGAASGADTATGMRSRVPIRSVREGSSRFARAVAWMESGFQPHVVSAAGALGVMQVTPATWDFVETVLLRGTDVPNTTEGNIRVGVLFLRHLLREFGGDERLALAAYYQGAKAVRDHGLFKVTVTYVEAIRSLKGRV